MEEHAFQIRILFGTVGIFAGYEAMKADRWQRYVFWALTVGFGIIALSWSWLQDIYAPATQFVVGIATNGETWVVLFALIIAAFWYRAQIPTDQDAQSTTSTDENRTWLSEQLEIQENRLKGEISGTKNWIQDLHEANQDLLKRMAEIERRTARTGL